MKESGDDEEEGVWARVTVPFDEFKLVRGPRLVPDGPPLDVLGGIYQIGMTLSKFQMAQNTTELEDFRPGFFDMHIRRIGFYGDDEEEDTSTGAAASVEKKLASSSNDDVVVVVPDTLTKKEAEKKRPLVLKMILPIAKVFFSERANRRRSAMRILREERNMSRSRAIMFGFRSRKESMG